MSSGSNADKPFTILLGKYYRKEQNAWDRVLLEDPLDPPEPEFVPNFASTGTQAITIRQAVATTIQAIEDSRVIATLRYIAGTTTTGLGQNEEDPWSSTAWPGGNQPPPNYIPPSITSMPWARNGKERRILKALGKGLLAAIQRAEKAIGRRDEARYAETWNSRFWEFITRPKPPRKHTGTRTVVDRGRLK